MLARLAAGAWLHALAGAWRRGGRSRAIRNRACTLRQAEHALCMLARDATHTAQQLTPGLRSQVTMSDQRVDGELDELQAARTPDLNTKVREGEVASVSVTEQLVRWPW